MRVGIIGLPQTGKTTVFNAITGAHGEVGVHGRAGTHLGAVKVPDERMDFLVNLFAPKKTRPATIEFEDIGGMFAHLGPEAQDNTQAVATARTMDALSMVLRVFADPTVPHIFQSVNPARDFARMNEEMLLADLGVVEKRIEHIKKDIIRCPATEREPLQEEMDLLEHCRQAIELSSSISSVKMTATEEKMVRSYAFLTLKPFIYVLNEGEDQIGRPQVVAGLENLDPAPVVMYGKLEMELMALEPQDREAFMRDSGLEELSANKVARLCYKALDVRTFFTYAHDEVGAWTIHAGDTAVAAAGRVHTDMAHGFVKAEVVRSENLKAAGSLKEAKARGKVRLEGRDYVVQDGDVITFRFTA